MSEPPSEIRNAARALIIQRGNILLLKKEYDIYGTRYALPGGGQNPGESLHEALNRECLEEINTNIEIGDLLHIADFIKYRSTQPQTRRHVVEFIFKCLLPIDYTPTNGPKPDKHQVDVVWHEIDRITDAPIFPSFLSTCLQQYQNPHKELYLGKFQDHAITQKH